MKVRDIVKGAIVVAAVAGFFYITNRSDNQDTTPDTQVSQDTTEETERRIEKQFNTEIPEGADRAELRGSEDTSARALATREVVGSMTKVAILADLDDPESGTFYQAWIQRGEEDSEEFERLSLGRLRTAKGGWVVEYSSEEDLSEYDRITISKETSLDSEVEETLLEGSFN